MRIAVVGAGAMGSLFAGRLALAGHDVVLAEVDARRREAIVVAGLRLDIGGESHTLFVPCGLADEMVGGCELLIVFTKHAALRPALEQAVHALAAQGVVLVLANGLGIAKLLSDLVPPERLVLGVTDVAADLLDGVVHSDGTGIVKIGSADAHAPVASLQLIAQVLTGAKFPTHVQVDVRTAIWEKVAFNGAFNAAATIIDADVAALDNPHGRRLVVAALEEVAAVAAAQGIAFDLAAVRDRVEAAFRHQANHLPSMVQDRRAGRPTEIAAINQAVADRGEVLGVPVPVNRTLADLVALTGG